MTRRLLVAVAIALAAPLMLTTAMPANVAELAGGATSHLNGPAFAAGVETPGVAAAAPTVDNPVNYYFHGQTPSDDPTRVAGPPYTATFDDAEPTTPAPVTQTATGVASADYAGNPLGVFWQAPVTGTFSGDVEFRWYWSSSDAAAIADGDEVTVSVFADADPTTGDGTLIGQATTTFQVTPAPALQVTRVHLNGTAANSLLVQVTPDFIDTGEGTTATYGSTDFPSSFAYPVPPLPQAPVNGVNFATDNLPTFAPATIASAHFLAGEPQTTIERPIAGASPTAGIDPNRIFVDWPLSTRTQTGQLSRSLDGGNSFRLLLDPTCASRNRPTCQTGGGGDTEEDVNRYTGTLFFADQEALAQESLASSTDHGDTFPAARQFPATAAATGVDRQWLAAAPPDVSTTPFGTMDAFYAYHVPDAGQYVVGIDPSGVPHPPPAPQIQGVTQSGQLRVDNSNGPGHGWIYQPFNASGFRVATANMANYLDPTAWQTNTVATSTPSLFTWLSLDDHGNAYATWVTNGQVMYSYSNIDDPANNPTLTPPGRPGTKWSDPVRISLPQVGSAIFSQSIAGAPGRLAIAYDGTTDFTGVSDGPPKADGSQDNHPTARWHTYVAIIDNALAVAPTAFNVRTGIVDHRIVHTGNICTSGTTCIVPDPTDPTAPAKDRSPLDLIDIGLDTDGRVGVAFTDNNSALQTPSDPNNPREAPFIHFAKSISGPSLLGATNINVTPASNPVTDATGDATWPNTASGTNLASLDITGASIGLDGANVVAKIGLSDVTTAKMAADLATYNASNANAPSGAQRLQYVLRFSTSRDVGADGRAGDVDFLSVDTPTDGTFRAFGGTLDANDAITNGVSILGSGYHKDFDASLTIDTTTNQLVITAPASKFGSTFGVGTQVFSVTAFAMAGPSEANETLITNVNRTVDATTPFDAVLAQPAAAAQSAPTAALVATPTSGGTPLPVTLDSSSSTPGTTPIANRTYDFGDGAATVTTTSERVTHVYDHAGTFTAKVTVTDTNGLTSTAQTVVTVRTGPTAALSASPTAGTAPLDVQFDASKSTAGADQTGNAATITSYQWIFGDGTTATTSTPTTQHTYSAGGTYGAAVIVTNSNGDARRSAGVPVTVFPGYWMVAADGGIFSHGAAPFFGSMGNQHLNKPIVGMAATATHQGYYLVATDGGIFAFGDASFAGSMGDKHLNKPIVGMTTTPTGNGYWMVASDGGIFSFGDAKFFGSMGDQHLNKPIVGMAATPTGNGYYLVASDGGIFSFGDAQFLGSQGGSRLNQPIVGMATTPTGGGYWMVASDGGIFSFGDAPFLGSMGGTPLTRPMVGISATGSGQGYWMDASDGGIFAFGDATFAGSEGNRKLNSPVVGMASA